VVELDHTLLGKSAPKNGSAIVGSLQETAFPVIAFSSRAESARPAVEAELKEHGLRFNTAPAVLLTAGQSVGKALRAFVEESKTPYKALALIAPDKKTCDEVAEAFHGQPLDLVTVEYKR
jgi:hypothetical protein